MLHLSLVETDQQLQEIATDIRGITEIPQVSVDAAQKTLTLHGTAAQIAVAEWLLIQWNPSAPAAHEYRMSGDDIVRVFRLGHAPTPQSLQEAATIVRSTADIRRLFTYYAGRVITVRGSESQIALAEWLMNQLDQSPNHAGAHEFHPARRRRRCRAGFLYGPRRDAAGVAGDRDRCPRHRRHPANVHQ